MVNKPLKAEDIISILVDNNLTIKDFEDKSVGDFFSTFVFRFAREVEKAHGIGVNHGE